MAYIIDIKDHCQPTKLMAAIRKHIEKDGRFQLVSSYMETVITDKKVQLDIGKVRLTKAKPYCGQHPGECFTGGPRRKGKWLEWEDWVAFHSLINDVLDKLDINANITTKPMEAIDKPPPGLRSGYMYIRLGKKRRYHYDWQESPGQFGRPIRYWNPGTPDQFEQERS